MAVGYFNDSVAAANPSGFVAVLADEQAKFVSPLTIDPKGGVLSVKVSCPLDPWAPTNGASTA
jgi:hypothetical protein